MTEETRALYQWLAKLAEVIDADGVPMDEEAVHILLDLARDAAHHTVRPAAPLTTFMVGVAVGRGQSLESSAAAATRLALSQDESAQDE